MAGPRYPGFDTLALHAGQSPDPATGSRAVPIYQTTSYVFRAPEHAASLFNMERAGHVYSRISNPTVAVLEERVAALEGGVGAVATASGQAALHLAIATLMDAGSHIVASTALYGGSHNLLAYTLKRFGIDTTFVTPRKLDDWQRAIRPNTRLLFGETLGNPGLDVLDIPALADIAHRAKLPLLVDATFTTPYLMAPMTAFQILQGVETLHLRMPRHVEATRKVVQFLASHAAVAKVIHPELPEHPDHALCKRLLPLGAGAVFSFEIKGGRAAGKAF